MGLADFLLNNITWSGICAGWLNNGLALCLLESTVLDSRRLADHSVRTFSAFRSCCLCGLEKQGGGGIDTISRREVINLSR